MITLPIIFVALAINLTPQDSVKVTFSQPAMTLERLLPKLGEAAAVKMEADKSIRNEVVMVRVKNMPLQVLMAKVAEVSAGKWDEEDGKQILYLDRNKANNERNAELQLIVRSIQEHRADSNPIYSRDLPTLDLNTSDYWARKLMDLVPAEDLARMEPFQTIRYALPANRSQRPLPRQAALLAVQWLSTNKPRIDGEVSKVVVSITCHGMGMYNGDIKLARADGKCLLRSNSSIGRRTDRKGAAKLALPQPDAAVELSAVSEQIRSRIGMTLYKATGCRSTTYYHSEYGSLKFSAYSRTNPTTLKPIDGQARNAVVLPAENEPLEYPLGESLRSFAASQNANIVACLPDSALIKCCPALSRKTRADAYLHKASDDWDLCLKLENGCFLVRPQAPSMARLHRLDRQALQTLLAQIGSFRPVSTDAWASYFAVQPLLEDGESFESAWISMANPEQSLDTDTSFRKAYKFLGLLGKSQLQLLRSGNAVLFSSIPAQAKSFFFEYSGTFNRDSRRVPSARNESPYERFAEQLADEIDEVVPDLASMQASLSLKRIERPIVFGISKSGVLCGLDYNAFPDAPTLDVYEDDGTSHVEGYPIRYAQYSLASRIVESLSISVNVNPKVYQSYRYYYAYTDDSLAHNARAVSFAETPKEFQQWVLKNEAELDRQRQQEINDDSKRIVP